jgi:quercetin dioxygenase-like cupin family protein/ketosteroid isomerase-like protein
MWFPACVLPERAPGGRVGGDPCCSTPDPPTDYDHRVSDSSRLIRAYYEARARGDRTSVATSLADAVAWHDPYPPPHGGDIQGRDAVLRDVFDAAGELTGGSSRFWLVDQLSVDDLVVALVGWSSAYRGRVIDTRELAVYRVADDVIAEAWFYPEEPMESWRFFAREADAEPAEERLAGAAYRFVDQLVRVRATGAETGGAFGLVDIETPAGAGPPPHRHADEDEMLVVLRGTLNLTIGPDRREVESGHLVHLPRQVDHGYRAGSEPLRHLNLVQPAGFEAFFLEAGTPIGDTRRSLDPVALGVMASRYGVTLLGPPPDQGYRLT